MHNFIRIVIPFEKDDNVVEKDLENDQKPEKWPESEIDSTQKTTQKTTQKILEIMIYNPHVTIEYLCEACGLTRDGLNWNIRKMKNKGLIKRVGPDKGGHWEIINNDKKITVMQFNQP